MEEELIEREGLVSEVLSAHGYRLGTASSLLISCRLAVQDERGQAISPRLHLK